ncbi:hypothetical protein PanWU01x14_265660 [Parasponia andersonii]|uniref:Uncharacterized protein n=1 Tax=Parasponia andersonii TaxID=3476 RepID=A0A2P5B746_PARAD|nr:hypothetical protein PanWU01x14_265660 [Parasponia andersonii]
MSKSTITYSPNVDMEVRTYLQELLGLEACNSLSKYLGLPSMLERNKQLSFMIIKEKVWKKLQSWRSQLFSNGGIEILIKAVAIAIPNYTMGVFKIPPTLCHDLQGMVTKFWWGDLKTKDQFIGGSERCYAFLREMGVWASKT